jgi:alkylated DNA repair protein (DNA oxidative demethylase)
VAADGWRDVTGFVHLPGFISQTQVDDLAAAGRRIIAAAPLMAPTMRDGTALKVRVTSAGAWGWWADPNGYRYVDRHPGTGEPFPPIDPLFRDLTAQILARAGYPGGEAFAASVDSVLINWYAPGASLGWHVDRTEEDSAAPIVSISIGDTALFEIKDGEAVRKYVLINGDACVQGGPSRAAEHRIARVYEHEMELGRPRNPLAKPGRLNFTIRRNRRPTC